MHADSDDEDVEKGKSGPSGAGAARSGGGGGGVEMTAASSARMNELEAPIFAMAKRQQELALALSAPEARTASLNAAVQSTKDVPVLGGEPLLTSGSSAGGVFIGGRHGLRSAGHLPHREAGSTGTAPARAPLVLWLDER